MKKDDDKIPSPLELQLLALTVQERPGREIAKLYEQGAGKAISYGALYTTLRRMRETGWVSAREDSDEDGRIRYFKIKGAGATALHQGREHYRALSTFGAVTSRLMSNVTDGGAG